MIRKLSPADYLDLSIPERIRLVEEIWDSIAEVPEAVSLTEAQRRKLDARLQDDHRDPSAGSPWEEVKAAASPMSRRLFIRPATEAELAEACQKLPCGRFGRCQSRP